MKIEEIEYQKPNAFVTKETEALALPGKSARRVDKRSTRR